MGSTLKEVDQTNFVQSCFLPSPKKGRESLGFQPHEEGYYHLQIYHSNAVKDWGLNAYSDRQGFIETKKEEIEDHVARRIQLFFQQAILCYNTPFVYDAEGAEDQIGVGNKTKGTQAAHSSTFPCLYAYPKDAQGAIDSSKKFVFLKYGHAYTQHNGTMELPDEVNKLDTFLDGKTAEEGKLRNKALKIINDVAEGKINPTKATKRFLRAFENRLIDIINTMPEKDLRRNIAQIYLNRVQEVREDISESSSIFDQIMGVNLATTGSEKVLRRVVYQQRYELIQQAEFIESQIAKKLFEAQKAMLGIRSKSAKSVDYRLRYVLLKGASTEKERKFFEKLFCTSLEQLTTGLEYKQDKLRRVANAVNKFAKDHEVEIGTLKKELRMFHQKLQKLEMKFRAKLFRGLRVDFKEWTQKKFSALFKEQYPDEAMSQPMVSRLEQPGKDLPAGMYYKTPENQRAKRLDIEKARKIASIYEVDVGLFLPGLISSE